MDNFKVVTFTPREFADLLGLETDEVIEKVSVSYSPMLDEWSMTVGLVKPVDEAISS